MKYAIYVFLGSCSFGVLSTIVKLAYGEGYQPHEVVLAQYIFGWLMMSAIMLKKGVSTTKKEKIQLLLAGIMTAVTSITYNISLSHVSASLGIILLFQFTWIGLLLESITMKKPPSLVKIITIVIILFGTALAGGLIGSKAEWNATGVIFGLISAVSYAFSIYFNGAIAPNLQSITKGYYIGTGALIAVAIVFPPTFLLHIETVTGLAKYGILLGFFGLVIPPILFAAGVPKIGTGLATILGAAELPVVILLSMFVLKEDVSGVQWMGVLLILMALILPQLPQVKRKKRTSNI
ncbi:EamA family transporter [Bacillus massiliigorillae]|uniref:EamA family transporter n=1 Tax=Bacillus massiliigorillae TaxID=1243664 RepID=UPI00039B185A|nr:DMT family transporter [Bacillus massiliigorillae]